MKPIKLILVFLILCISVVAQNTGNDAASIRAQMAAIRKNTAWNDPAAAKAANAKIQELAAKLTQALRQGNPNAPQMNGMTKDEAAELQKEADDFNNELWNQMMKIVSQGEGAKWDMGEPLREEIVQEYKDDEDPTIKNNEWFETMPTLVLNLSWPHIKLIIDQMTLFRGIKTLIVTCDQKGTAVDLEIILKNAAGYPLEELYILNFGNTVSSLPSGIGNFSGLKRLSLLNNAIQKLPPTVANLGQLEILHIDLNPVPTLISQVGNLKELKQLGVGKTKIPETELSQIKQMLPACEILR